MEGIEPTTPRLQITCSGQLSYIGKMSPFAKGLQIYNFFFIKVRSSVNYYGIYDLLVDRYFSNSPFLIFSAT